MNDFLKNLKESLDNGNPVDSNVTSKINEINEISKLAEQKQATNDFKNIEKHLELAKQGYFKNKVTQEDVDKANQENEEFNKNLEKEKVLTEFNQKYMDALTNYENMLRDMWRDLIKFNKDDYDENSEQLKLFLEIKDVLEMKFGERKN